MGQVDAIITSPLYADQVVRPGGRDPGDLAGLPVNGNTRRGRVGKAQGHYLDAYGTADGQVGALKPGPCPGGEVGVGDVGTLTWAGVYKDSWKSMGLLVSAAYSHPAKVAPGLAMRLFDHGFQRGWWRKGDLVADPFCGICGFGVIAAYKGLRFVGVEIEERFHTLCLENVALHRRRWESGGDPTPICLLGDSREFAKLVGGVTKLLALWDVYEAGGGADRLGDFGAWVRSVLAEVDAGAGAALVAGALPCGDADSVITSPPYADTGSHGNMKAGAVDCNSWTDGRPRKMGPSMNAEGYGTSPGQLGALKAGDADSVITSPPWVDPRALSPRDNAAWVASGRLPAEGSGPGTDLNAYGATPGQLGALPAGDADGVLTSPPYAAAVHGRNGIDLAKCDRPGAHTQAGAQGYGDTPGNVGGLPAGDADSVVTSPPYESQALNDNQRKSGGQRGRKSGGHWKSGDGTMDGPTEYGTAPGQVGALRQETYWSAMKIIWEQSFLALRPNGVLCCVIKDFVRAKKRVPLCDQTWRLLLSLGFQPVERIRCLLSEETREPSLFGGEEIRKRERKSFFRRLAEKKGSPVVDAEEILVVRRPPAGAEEGGVP